MDIRVNLWQLRLSMAGTVAIIIGASTLGFTVLLSLLGSLNIYSLILVVAIFNLIQWLFAPYIVNTIYGVKQLGEEDHPELHNIVNDVSTKSGMKKPKLMLSKISIPNAFAYGSPLTGPMVAVTRGLVNELEIDEIEAVLGHEIGHLKHGDVQVMMFVSFLPSLFYMIARSMLFSSYYGGRDRRDSGGLALVGGFSMLIYFFLLIFTLGLSRLREYYADQHSISVIHGGRKKLSEALAKISSSTWRIQKESPRRISISGFKTLFISDPDRAGRDSTSISQYGNLLPDEELVESLLGRKITFLDRFTELFSTHPNIVKRLRALNA